MLQKRADRFIETGNVFINGKHAKVGDKVKPGDVVKVNGNTIEPREKEHHIYIALNKPVGVTSTTEANVRDNIVSFVNHTSRIFPIGRLDKDSQGLIFLTSNGDIVNKILRAANKHEKEYLVTVNKPVTDEFIEKMSNGVPILGTTTKKCKVSREATNVFRITLIQGLNRQIRRMCEYFQYEVTKLERVRIMNVKLSGIPLGEWRELRDDEMKGIFSLLENSSADVSKNHPQKKKSKSAQKRAANSSPNKTFKPGNRSKNKNSKRGSSRPKFNRNDAFKNRSAKKGKRQ